MKQYTVYVCDVCEKESEDHDEIELCQAQHLKLGSLKNYHSYNALKDYAKYCTYLVGNNANDETRAVEDQAYKDLLKFEREHNMTR